MALFWDNKRQRLGVISLVLAMGLMFALFWPTFLEVDQYDRALTQHAMNPFQPWIGIVGLMSLVVTGTVIGLFWPTPSLGHLAPAFGIAFARYMTLIWTGDPQVVLVIAIIAGLVYLLATMIVIAIKAFQERTENPSIPFEM